MSYAESDKLLAYDKTGKYRKGRKGHDLLLLFNDLDRETKAIIERIAGAHGIKNIKPIVTKHREDFIEWRYGDGHLTTDVQDLDIALNILIQTIGDPEFLALCGCRPRIG